MLQDIIENKANKKKTLKNMYNFKLFEFDQYIRGKYLKTINKNKNSQY